MKLWVWRPGWDSMHEFHRQVNRLMDLTWNFVEQQMSQGWNASPMCNIYETESSYLVITPMPGVAASEVDVQVMGNALHMRGERKRPTDVEDSQYRRQERWIGKLSRSLPLPDLADPERIAANLDHGLLTVTIQKLPVRPMRQVEVKVGSSTGTEAAKDSIIVHSSTQAGKEPS